MQRIFQKKILAQKGIVFPFEFTEVKKMDLELAIREFPTKSGFQVVLPERNGTFKDPEVQKKLDFLCGHYSGTEDLKEKIGPKSLSSDLMLKLQAVPPSAYDLQTLRIIGCPKQGYYLALQRKSRECYCPVAEIKLL